MRIRTLAIVWLLLSAACFGQIINPGGSILTSSGAPIGTCSAAQLDVDTATGNLYSCNAGSWQLVSSGGGNTTSGTLTANKVTKATAAHTVADSSISDDGTTISTTVAVDLSGASHTLTIKRGVAASKPATCTQGEIYFATDATAGQNLYFCTATNTWTQQVAGGGSGTVNSGTAGNLAYYASSTNAVSDSSIATSSLAIPGQITVVHSNGTQTIYNPASNTDTARGTALKAAQAAAVAGDTIYPSPNNYYMGDCSSNAIGASSAKKCVDLSLGGTGSVNLIGSPGTVIYTDYGAGNACIIVQSGATSEIANVTISSTVPHGQASVNYCSPLGTVSYDGGTHASTPITAGYWHDLTINGVSDGIGIFHTAAAVTSTNIRLERAIVNSVWDAITVSADGGIISGLDVRVNTTADTLVGSPDSCLKGVAVSSTSTFVFDMTNFVGVGVGASGHPVVCVELNNGVSANLRSGYISVSGTSSQPFSLATTGATSYAHINPYGFGYDTTLAHGAGTIDNVLSNMNQLFGTLPTGLQGNGAKLQMSTGSTTTNNCVKFDANGNTIDAGTTCGGSGSPGGSDTQVQYNSSGSFAGSANFTFASNVLSLGADNSVAGNLQLANSAAAFHTNIITGATANWTFKLPANVFTTNHAMCASTLSTVMGLEDCGFTASAGSITASALDLSGGTVTTAFKPPAAAGAAPVTAGVVAFDTTNNNLAYGNGSTTNHSVYVTGSTPSAGIARFAGSTYAETAAELSGDCSTSGSNAVTCTQINGNNFTVNTSGLVTKDDGLTTAGLGHPVILATYDATNLTATSGPNTLLASAPAGFYKMEAYLYTTTSNGTSTMTVTPNWNDGVASHTNTSNTCSASGNNFVVSQTPFYVAAGQTIAWTNTLSGTIGSATYGLHIVLWRVN